MPEMSGEAATADTCTVYVLVAIHSTAVRVLLCPDLHASDLREDRSVATF